MVTELSLVQLGLKSYALFQNQMSLQQNFRFKIKCKVSDQNCMTKFNYHFHPIWKPKVRCLIQAFWVCSNILLCQCIDLVSKKLPKLSPIFLKFDWFPLRSPNFIGRCVLVKLSHWLGKRCNSEDKWCDL